MKEEPGPSAIRKTNVISRVERLIPSQINKKEIITNPGKIVEIREIPVIDLSSDDEDILDIGIDKSEGEVSSDSDSSPYRCVRIKSTTKSIIHSSDCDVDIEAIDDSPNETRENLQQPQEIYESREAPNTKTVREEGANIPHSSGEKSQESPSLSPHNPTGLENGTSENSPVNSVEESKESTTSRQIAATGLEDGCTPSPTPLESKLGLSFSSLDINADESLSSPKYDHVESADESQNVTEDVSRENDENEDDLSRKNSEIENEPQENSEFEENVSRENSEIEDEPPEKSEIEDESRENSENEDGMSRENTYIEDESRKNSEIEDEPPENTDIEDGPPEKSENEDESRENAENEDELRENSEIDHDVSRECSENEDEPPEKSEMEDESCENFENEEDVLRENVEIEDESRENNVIEDESREYSEIENEPQENADIEDDVSRENTEMEDEPRENSDIEDESRENSEVEDDVSPENYEIEDNVSRENTDIEEKENSEIEDESLEKSEIENTEFEEGELRENTEIKHGPQEISEIEDESRENSENEEKEISEIEDESRENTEIEEKEIEDESRENSEFEDDLSPESPVNMVNGNNYYCGDDDILPSSTNSTSNEDDGNNRLINENPITSSQGRNKKKSKQQKIDPKNKIYGELFSKNLPGLDRNAKGAKVPKPQQTIPIKLNRKVRKRSLVNMVSELSESSGSSDSEEGPGGSKDRILRRVPRNRGSKRSRNEIYSNNKNVNEKRGPKYRRIKVQNRSSLNASQSSYESMKVQRIKRSRKLRMRRQVNMGHELSESSSDFEDEHASSSENRKRFRRGSRNYVSKRSKKNESSDDSNNASSSKISARRRREKLRNKSKVSHTSSDHKFATNSLSTDSEDGERDSRSSTQIGKTFCKYCKKKPGRKHFCLKKFTNKIHVDREPCTKRPKKIAKKFCRHCKKELTSNHYCQKMLAKTRIHDSAKSRDTREEIMQGNRHSEGHKTENEIFPERFNTDSESGEREPSTKRPKKKRVMRICRYCKKQAVSSHVYHCRKRHEKKVRDSEPIVISSDSEDEIQQQNRSNGGENVGRKVPHIFSHDKRSSSLRYYDKIKRFSKVCPKCNKKFPTVYRLKVHQRLHNGLRYCCIFCNKPFMETSSLARHALAVHGDTLPWKCGKCSASFEGVNPLKKHAKKHHLGYDPMESYMFKRRLARAIDDDSEFELSDKELLNISSPSEVKVTTKQARVRSFCNRKGSGIKFDSIAELKRHLSLNENTEGKSCEICKVKSKGPVDRMQHLYIHLKICHFQCPHCPTKYRQPQYLKSHCKLKHNELRPFRCKMDSVKCTKDFASIKEYYEHASLKHYSHEELYSAPEFAFLSYTY